MAFTWALALLGSPKILRQKFGRDFDAEFWSIFWSTSLIKTWGWSLVKILLRFCSWHLVEIVKFDQLVIWHKTLQLLLWEHSTYGSVVPLTMFENIPALNISINNITRIDWWLQWFLMTLIRMAWWHWRPGKAFPVYILHEKDNSQIWLWNVHVGFGGGLAECCRWHQFCSSQSTGSPEFWSPLYFHNTRQMNNAKLLNCIFVFYVKYIFVQKIHFKHCQMQNGPDSSLTLTSDRTTEKNLCI